MTGQLKAVGNNGGDVLEIRRLSDGRLQLKVGHCRVWTIHCVLPVEILTALLSRAVMESGSIEDTINKVNWPIIMRSQLKNLVQHIPVTDSEVKSDDYTLQQSSTKSRHENEYTLDSVLIFGKYNGWTIADVMDENLGYITWCLDNIDLFRLDDEADYAYRMLKDSATFDKLEDEYDPLAKYDAYVDDEITF